MAPAPTTPRAPLPVRPTSRQLLETALKEPELPGDPAFERNRAAILARAKSTPVFFVRAPQDEPASAEIAYYRARIRSARFPWTPLRELLPYFEHFPEKGKQTLLRDGYLYAETPNLAFALVSLVGARDLFDAEHIWIQRGELLMHAKRKGFHYVFEDGPYAGERVRLMHLDRLGAGAAPEDPPLHRDFRSLRYRLGFDRVRVRHIGRHRIVADLRYRKGLWVPTILRSRGARLELEGEVVPSGRAEELLRARRKSLKRIREVQALRHAMLEQIAEALPFDEPRTEVGQQDGVLRRSWRFVYTEGRGSYEVNRDRYRVFDVEGRPRVPQVCVDFLLDTFERASGTWWRDKGEPRERRIGALDFESELPRLELRRTKRFLQFASDHPAWFDVLSIPENQRIEQGDKPRFFAYLAKHADDFAPGDMVFIRGKTPWDDREEHTHSFFVYESDPMTGVPIAIASNANTPSIWSWEAEARRTPQRTLRYRVRPTEELLRLAAPPDAPLAPVPPPLSP